MLGRTKQKCSTARVEWVPHLTLRANLLNAAIGVNTTHVPYRGGGTPMQDLIASRIDYFCPLTTIAIPQIESKTVKAIAIFSKHRLSILPNLASAHEQGLTNFEVYPWYAFFLPKGTPASIVQKLREATVATMATPAVQERLADLGYALVTPDRRSSEYLQKFTESELEKWAGLIKTVGVAAQVGAVFARWPLGRKLDARPKTPRLHPASRGSGGGVAARGARAARRADAPDRNSDAVPADKRGNAGARARLPRGAAKTWLGGGRQRPVRRALDQRQHGLRSLHSREPCRT